MIHVVEEPLMLKRQRIEHLIPEVRFVVADVDVVVAEEQRISRDVLFPRTS